MLLVIFIINSESLFDYIIIEMIILDELDKLNIKFY